MEIGSAALNILVECWDGHLTPPEVASLADRASRARDPNMVRAAAELALSCLPHAHALNPNEIQRALVQCKEQVPLRPPSALLEDGEGALPPGARSPVPPLPRSAPLAPLAPCWSAGQTHAPHRHSGASLHPAAAWKPVGFFFFLVQFSVESLQVYRLQQFACVMCSVCVSCVAYTAVLVCWRHQTCKHTSSGCTVLGKCAVLEHSPVVLTEQKNSSNAAEMRVKVWMTCCPLSPGQPDAGEGLYGRRRSS